jgi:hypothetical protein
MLKHRAPNPSEICALDSKQDFDDPRFGFGDYRHRLVDSRRLNRRTTVRSDAENAVIPYR